FAARVRSKQSRAPPAGSRLSSGRGWRGSNVHQGGWLPRSGVSRKLKAMGKPPPRASATLTPRRAWREVLGAFLRLGLTSFGGPVAHLGYFREEFVVRRRWLEDRAYADVVALCQFLPGPASSQVGIAIGLSRAGYPGALAAWIGFTLPSAVLMVLFAYGVTAWGDVAGSAWLHGLKVAAVALVAPPLLRIMPPPPPHRLLPP